MCVTLLSTLTESRIEGERVPPFWALTGRFGEDGHTLSLTGDQKGTLSPTLDYIDFQDREGGEPFTLLPETSAQNRIPRRNTRMPQA